MRADRHDRGRGMAAPGTARSALTVTGRGTEQTMLTGLVPVSREQAWATLTRYTKSEALLRHALAVEAANAAGVSRDDVYHGAELLEIDLDEHIANVIAALQPIAAELGLRSEAA